MSAVAEHVERLISQAIEQGFERKVTSPVALAAVATVIAHVASADQSLRVKRART